MKNITILLSILALAACSSPEEKSGEGTSADTTGQAKTIAPLVQPTTFSLLDLPNLDDNVHNDTLLIYTTHAIGNGEFVMAAKNVVDTRDGLRLILYRPRQDSSAEVISASKPAFDSEVMLPTYFSTGDSTDGVIILANYGGLESWGQNAFWLKDGRFKDLGWIDLAERGFKTRLDSLQQWRSNIAPKTKVLGSDGQFQFTFATDSVQLYDDLTGHQEVMLPSYRISYRYDGKQMVLLIDGHPRFPQPL